MGMRCGRISWSGEPLFSLRINNHAHHPPRSPPAHHRAPRDLPRRNGRPHAQVMRGEVSPVMTAAIFAGLRVKKETIDEIAGAAKVLREFALPVPVADKSNLVDIVGTGGDGAHTFNI